MTELITVMSINKTYKTPILDGSLIEYLLKRKYRYVHAVSDVSFSVSEGEVLGLIGLNGAGKTSVIKMVSGIMKPDSGSVAIAGNDPFKKSRAYKHSVTLVMGQSGQLNVDLTIFDNIAFHAALYGVDKKTAFSRAEQMASEIMLDVADMYKQVRMLSLGQRMKGELILSFIHLPKIIFLDEPTIGLDFKAQNAIRHFLAKYVRQQGASAILTSHYMKDIGELCSRLLILNKGKGIFYGSVSELKAFLSNSSDIELDELLEMLYRGVEVD